MKIKISIAQLEYEHNNISNNCKKIIEIYQEAVKQSSHLVIFSDLAITGYPPTNQITEKNFVNDAMKALKDIAMATEQHSTFILVGGIYCTQNIIQNSMFLIGYGQIFTSISKHTLESNDIFDEFKIFTPSLIPKTIMVNGIKINVIIGSDIELSALAKTLKNSGTNLIIAACTTIYTKQSCVKLIESINKITNETSLPIIYINQVGANNTNTIKGGSFIMSSSGKIVHRMKEWSEEVSHTEWEISDNNIECTNGVVAEQNNEIENILHAMQYSLKNFINTKKFDGIAINITDMDIGSMISMAIAKKVHNNTNTYSFKYTDNEIIKDIHSTHTYVPIDNILNTTCTELSKSFDSYNEKNKDSLYKKLMSTFIESIAKEKNTLLLSTADKTDISLGKNFYTNIFAEYNIVGDIYKTELYKIAEFLNKNTKNNEFKIPEEIINLSNDQSKQIIETDSILSELIENDASPYDLEKMEYNKITIKKIYKSIYDSWSTRNKTIKPLRISESSFEKIPLLNKKNFDNF